MYISGVITHCCRYWHTAIQIHTNSCLKKKTWHPNGLKSLNVIDVILNFGHLIHLLDFDVLEKDPAWIAYDLCWACASWCLDTVSNPGRKALSLVQRAQLWPAVYQKMDARTLKTGLEIRALATSTARRDSDRASFSSSSDLVDVTRNDLQRRFLAEHSVAMLEQCCSYSKQCCNVVLR